MENEIIVDTVFEGGGLTLYGQHDGRGWLFSTHMTDQSLSFCDDGPFTERTSNVVNTWAAALKLLDDYEFNHLHPLAVHPDFRAKVLKAVLARNERSQDTHCQVHWQKICGLTDKQMYADDLYDNPIIQEIEIPKFGSTQGRLFAANPPFARPSNIKKVDWALSFLQKVRNQTTVGNKSVLAVPRSFWPLSTDELHEYAKSGCFEFVDLMDEWNGPRDYGFTTPMESIRQIIDHLQQGVDVIVLSQSKMISDFVRAVLFLVSQENADHPAKMWCEIAQDGRVELTHFQRGYIYGLMNATGTFGMERLRKSHHAERVRYRRTDV